MVMNKRILVTGSSPQAVDYNRICHVRRSRYARKSPTSLVVLGFSRLFSRFSKMTVDGVCPSLGGVEIRSKNARRF
jgi:hypothetical protein